MLKKEKEKKFLIFDESVNLRQYSLIINNGNNKWQLYDSDDYDEKKKTTKYINKKGNLIIIIIIIHFNNNFIHLNFFSFDTLQIKIFANSISKKKNS